MSRDRSLDEFLPDGAESDGDEEEPTAPGDGEGEPATTDREGEDPGVPDEDGQRRPTGEDAESGAAPRGNGDVDADPAHSTFEWSPDGEACDGCDRVVSRRWRNGDLLVCVDCKEW